MTAGKLGRLPFVEDSRDITFAKIATELVHPPANFGHGLMFHDSNDPITGWGMNGNGPDETVAHGFQGAGDCFWAAGAHTTRVAAKLGGHPVRITGKESIADYSAACGYRIGDDSTDVGTNMRAGLKYRQKVGLVDAAGNRHKIGAYVSIDPSDWDELMEACYVFSSVEIGFNFTQAQYDTFESGVWDYVPGSPSLGGHAVSVFGRNRGRGGIVSWGKHVWITRAFYENLNEETWAIIQPDELRNGKTERGMDLTQLNAELAALPR